MINKILVGVVIVIIVALIGFTITTLDIEDPTTDEDYEEYVELSYNWITENVATFTERGGENLEHIRTVEIGEGVYEITFEFDASFAGYGPVDDDEMAAQVITTHTVVVTVEDGNVVKVITDNKYDEISQEVIEEDFDEDVLELDVYFYKIEDGMEELGVVTRRVPVTQNVGTVALESLLEGPTAEELADGYQTAIGEGVRLLSLRIEDYVAYADFSSELDASGSATVMMIREQIEKTLLQFDTVEDVVISIEGETEEVLQP
jgi:hypothetical protein